MGKLGLTPVQNIGGKHIANPIKIIRKFIEVENTVGEFIRSGPDSGLPGHIRDSYRHRCDELANASGWARALGVLSRGSASRICQPYWDDQGTDGPVIDTPFSGGQCEGASYLVELAGSNSTGNPATSSRTVVGPVGGVCFGALNQFNRLPIGAQGANGCVISGGGAGVTSPEHQGSWSVTSVTRVGGLPDDCGDPPGEIIPGPNPPPNPGPLPGPEPTDDPRNPFGPPLFPIPPYIDPIFGPIPIVEDPESDGPGGGGNPSGGDGLPGSPDAIGGSAGGTTGGADGVDVDFGEPPEGKIWVAALVKATVDTRLGNIPGTGPEQTVYPTVIGNASLIYTGARGTNERLESASTLLARSTTALVLTGCRVQAQPGVTLTVSPITALTCPDNPCEDTNG